MIIRTRSFTSAQSFLHAHLDYESEINEANEGAASSGIYFRQAHNHAGMVECAALVLSAELLTWKSHCSAWWVHAFRFFPNGSDHFSKSSFFFILALRCSCACARNKWGNGLWNRANVKQGVNVIATHHMEEHIMLALLWNYLSCSFSLLCIQQVHMWTVPQPAWV